MSSANDVLKAMKKEHGDLVAKKGSEGYTKVTRLPTGIFPLDLAIGGGFPMGRVSIVFGPESSNKTNICLKAIGVAQKLMPHKKAVFVDAEGGYDPNWARKMGVNTDELILITPEFAEQAVDLIEAFLYADDVSVVVLDSIAALSTQNEIESSAEKMSVGGASLVLGKMFKKATVSFNRMRNQGLEPPAFIGINQTRFKIGVMFGDPETMPGGQALKFASSMTLRCYGKNELDKKIHPVLPAYKVTSIVVRKWKVGVLAINCEFKMQMIDTAENEAGYVNDWNTVSTYLKELGYLEKSKVGWVFNGTPYKLLDDIKAVLYSDPILLNDAKQSVIDEMMAKGTIGESKDEDVGASL